LLHWYALVGVPLIFLAGALGALKLADHDARKARELK
jgi:hypothetical protein